MPKKQINPSIEQDLLKQVQIKCIEEGTSISKVISELLTKWVGGVEEKPKGPQPMKGYENLDAEVKRELAEESKPTPQIMSFFKVGGVEPEEEIRYKTLEERDEWLNNL